MNQPILFLQAKLQVIHETEDAGVKLHMQITRLLSDNYSTHGGKFLFQLPPGCGG